MLRMSDERTYAELRYTKQSGINLIRFWGGGIAESDYFINCVMNGIPRMAGVLDDGRYQTST